MPIRSDQIFQNTVPADWRISVGATDITRLVRRLEISKPIPDQRSPQLISGSIELAQPLNVAQGRVNGVYAPGLETYQIDPVENPDFKAYAQPVTIFGEGRTIAVLRFTEDLRYDFNTGLGVGALGHRLLSVAQQSSNQVSNFAGSTSNVYDLVGDRSIDILSIGQYAQRLLVGATDGNGVSPFSESDLDVSALPSALANTYNQLGVLQTLGYEAEQDFSGAVDAIIHGIFFENTSRALEPIPGTERLRASDAYPISQGDLPLRLRLPHSQTLITVEDIALDEPGTIAKTSGGPITYRTRRTSSDYPKEVVTARFANGDPAETTVIDEPINNDDRTVTTFSRRAVESWLIEGSASNSIITRQETKTETFGDQGEPISREQSFTLTRHELGKLPVPGLQRYVQDGKDAGVTTQTQGLTIDTDWSYDSSGNIKTIATTYQLGRQYVFNGATGDGKVVALREEEVFENTVDSTVNPRWESFVTRMIPRGLIEESEATSLVADPDFTSESRILTSLPKPDYREPVRPITIQRFATNIQQAQVLGADDNPTQLDIQTTYAASEEAIAQLGRTMLAMNAQLREVWDVRMAMPSGFDLFGSWDLYHVDNGYEARAIALVGPFLIYENNGSDQEFLTYGGTAAQLGSLSGRIRPVPAPVQPILYIAPTPAVPNPVIPLSVDIVTVALVTSPGVLVTPFKLRAYGGTPPYIFSATGLPSGLSVVGDEIVGEPSAVTAPALVTVTVTDSVPATATTQFFIEVRQVAVPVPIYQIFKQSFAAASSQSFSLKTIPNLLDDFSAASATSFSVVVANAVETFASNNAASFSQRVAGFSETFAAANASSFSSRQTDTDVIAWFEMDEA